MLAANKKRGVSLPSFLRSVGASVVSLRFDDLVVKAHDQYGGYPLADEQGRVFSAQAFERRGSGHRGQSGCQIKARRDFGGPSFDLDGAFAFLRSLVFHSLYFYRFVLIRILQESDHVRGVPSPPRLVRPESEKPLVGLPGRWNGGEFPGSAGAALLIRVRGAAA